MSDRARILLVDDELSLRKALARLLRTEPSFELIGEANDGPSAVRLVAELKPDVILMDVKMPGDFGGVEATRRITAATASTDYPPMIIGLSASSELAEAMRKAGAAAFIPKERTLDLIPTIKRLIAER